MTTTPISVTHHSDILCVWAYVAQRRVDELEQEFGDRVAISYRMVSVFGFAREKLAERWRDKGGIAAYADHVRSVVDGFDHVRLHEGVWRDVVPTSSWPAHLILAAIRNLETAKHLPAGTFAEVAWQIRLGLFRDARDISRREVLFDILASCRDLDVAAIELQLETGAAHATLAQDDHRAREQQLNVSPSLVMGNDRQRLIGNVGYRVIAANVRELLEHPSPDQRSWC